MFNRDFDRRIYAFGATLLLSLAVGGAFGLYALWPPNVSVGYEPEQPIAFNHQLHAGDMAVPCMYCHTGAESGAQATVPPLAVCFNCHSQVKPKDKDGNLRKEFVKLQTHWDNKEPVKWQKVCDIPDFAYFDHSRHIARNVDCTECHGQVADMARVYRAYPLTMGWCLQCHKKPPLEGQQAATRGPLNCSACHR